MHSSSLSDVTIMVNTDDPSLQSSTDTNEPNNDYAITIHYSYGMQVAY